MIEAVVFDFDGMVYLTKEMFSDRISRDLNIPLEDVLDFFKRHFTKCQKNHEDLKEELKKYMSGWGWEKGIDNLLEYWFEDGHLNEEMVGIINDLKRKGMKCILCTNNEKHRMEYLKKNHGINDIFDGIVASCDIGFVKPEKSVFDKILEITNLPADHIIFCDDSERNIGASEEFGFVPLLYKGVEDFRKKLTVKGIDLDGE
jgi:putative hydrolase of the HAD superfamily